MLDHGRDDIFWRDFISLPGNPYRSKMDMSGFRCLFIYLTTKCDFSRYDYPLSFGYMASILRMNNAYVKILTQDIDNYSQELFLGYDLICFYPMVFSIDRILQYAEKIKEDHRDIRICFLNSDQHQHEMLLCLPNIESLAGALMEPNYFIDYILLGSAERSLLKLCEKLLKKDYDFAGVPSCLYREKNKIQLSEKKSEPVDFLYLPFPSRDYLEGNISSPGKVNIFSARIQSSRGCVSRCSYCVESGANLFTNSKKKIWSGRNIFRFVDEIEMLLRDFKVFFFNIIDSSFEDPGMKGIERMRQFFNEIRFRDIHASFKIHLRVETIDKLDNKDLKDMKEAGVDIIVLGVESGIERELRSYNKITTVEKNIKNILTLDSSCNFFSLLGHMMFSACLRLEDLSQKASFLKRIHRGWDYLNMSNNVIAFRGTVYHNYLKKKGLSLEVDPLSCIIPYNYEDERVRYVADAMGSLKVKCPEVAHLNNLLYDAQNIISRYRNKSNKHLWDSEKPFLRFKADLEKTLIDVEDIFIKYFIEIVELSFSNWSLKKADLVYKKWIPNNFPGIFEKTMQLVSDFIEGYNRAGLSTEKLYLKTWMSLINAEANTCSGKVK